MGIYIPNTFDVSGNAQVLGGSGGGNVPVPTGSTLNWNLQSFGSSGTWTKPAQAVYVEVIIMGAGGGGASGGRQAAGVVSRGGCGGGLPLVAWAVFTDQQLPSSLSVTIGAGGAGGAAVTADNTAGTAGGNGGGVSFGGYFGTTGGGGGTATTGGVSGSVLNTSNPFGPRPIGFVTNTGGAVSSAVGGIGASAGGQINAESYDRAGSSAGGGITTGNVANNGGSGSQLYTLNYVLSALPAAGAAPGGAGGNGVSIWQNLISQGPSMNCSGFVGVDSVGTAAGSGAANAAGAGGAGGTPGIFGAPGAGGGASRNGNNSGAGGAGGSGLVKVLTLYLT